MDSWENLKAIIQCIYMKFSNVLGVLRYVIQPTLFEDKNKPTSSRFTKYKLQINNWLRFEVIKNNDLPINTRSS